MSSGDVIFGTETMRGSQNCGCIRKYLVRVVKIQKILVVLVENSE